MSRRPRRNHTAELKSKVSLAAIRGEKTLSELGEQFDIHLNQIRIAFSDPPPVHISSPRRRAA